MGQFVLKRQDDSDNPTSGMENSMAASDNKNILAALQANWQAEMEGFYTYTALSKSEADPHRRNALQGLAMAEKHHADLLGRQAAALESSATSRPSLSLSASFIKLTTSNPLVRKSMSMLPKTSKMPRRSRGSMSDFTNIQNGFLPLASFQQTQTCF